MRSAIVIAFTAFLCIASLKSTGAQPDVPSPIESWLSALPNDGLTETVHTTIGEPVDITIWPVSLKDIGLLTSRMSSTPPLRNALTSFSSKPDPGSDGLTHTIQIPGMNAGLYLIRLATPQRIAMQRLVVTTLGLMANRTLDSSVAMTVDLRTLHMRRDINLTLYGENGPQVIDADPDGLFRFNWPWTGHTRVEPPTGTLVALAGDGSVAVLPFGWTLSAWDPAYTETDREVYRPGDPVYTRVVTRYKEPQEFATYLARADERNGVYELFNVCDHVAGKMIHLADDAATGIYRVGGIAVSDARRSRFEIEAAPLTRYVSSGNLARFVISVTDHRGVAYKDAVIDFAWHETGYPEALPIDERNDTQDLATSVHARATTDRNGNIEVALPMGARTLEFYVYDPDNGQIAATAQAQPFGQPASVADPYLEQLRENTFTVKDAEGVVDADALVYYGSGLHFRSTVARFSGSSTQFSITRPKEDDDFAVSVVPASVNRAANMSTVVSVAPKRHLLNVEITCAQRAALPSHRVHFCMRVRNWNGQPASARLLLTVRYASAAAIANVQTRAGDVYDTLYQPQIPNRATAPSWIAAATFPDVFLRPEGRLLPVRRAGKVNTGNQGSNAMGPSQTLLWNDADYTDPSGRAQLAITAPEVRGQSVMLHVIALARDSVGEANAWIR